MAEAIIDFDIQKVQRELLQHTKDAIGVAGEARFSDVDVVIQSRFKYSQVYEDDDGFFVYDIPDPFYDTLHESYIFQDERTFLENWYNDCDEYIKSLSQRELYILKRYTRHGDEIVNTLLRDPEGFAQNKRVQELLFDKMPDENHMLYAMQLIDRMDRDNHRHYITAHGVILSEEFRDLEFLENEYLGGMDRANHVAVIEKVLPLIHAYIDDLRTILWNGPRLPAPLQVFRCTNTDYLNHANQSAVVKGFMSTSLDSCIADFYHANRFVYQIVLQPGTPCLSIKSASRYYEEFEVLVDTNCFAMSTLMIEKHLLQNNIHSGEIDTEHVLIEPKNIVHKVRHIQVFGEGEGENENQNGGRVVTRRRSKSQRSQKMKSVRYSRRRSKGKPARQPSRKVSQKRLSRKPSISTRRRTHPRSLQKMRHLWKDRDASASPRGPQEDGYLLSQRCAVRDVESNP